LQTCNENKEMYEKFRTHLKEVSEKYIKLKVIVYKLRTFSETI